MGFWSKLVGAKSEDERISALVEAKLSTIATEKSGSWARFFASGRDMSDADQSPYQSVATVYKSVKAIIDNAPQAKPAFYNPDGEMVEDKELLERLLRPNPKQTWNDFIGELAGYYQLNGEIFILIGADTVGEQAGTKLPSLTPLNPRLVQERLDANSKTIAAWQYLGSMYPVDQIIHTKDFNPYNLFRGLAPVTPISRELSIDQNTLIFNEEFFKSDATPGITLETEKTLTEVQRQQLRTFWESQHKGVRKSFRMAVLEGGLKAKPITNSHKDMDFIEQKKLVREEIMGVWRAPKALFNITDNLNYATFNGQMKVFWQYTIGPMLRKFEDALNTHYVQRYRKNVSFGFDLRNVPAFAEDFKDKVASAQMLSQIGFTRNEINEELELGFEEQPWGDEWWVASGQTPASFLLMNDGTTDPAAPADGTDGAHKPADGSNDGQAAADGVQRAIERRMGYTVKDSALMKGFLKRQTVLEGKMASKLKRYFYNLRKDILTLPDSMLGAGQLSINWDDQALKLKTMVSQAVEDSVAAGIASAEDDVGRGKSAKDFNDERRSYIDLRVNKITAINQTVQKQIKKRIEPLLADGGTMTDIASAVRDEVRDFFNSAGVRAKLIARTETTGAMNGGSMMYYRESGFDKKRWLTAGDEFVRESHRECQAKGPVDIDEAFENGLMYPGDQTADDAGEVVNCRCRVVSQD